MMMQKFGYKEWLEAVGNEYARAWPLIRISFTFQKEHVCVEFDLLLEESA